MAVSSVVLLHVLLVVFVVLATGRRKVVVRNVYKTVVLLVEKIPDFGWGGAGLD